MRDIAQRKSDYLRISRRSELRRLHAWLALVSTAAPCTKVHSRDYLGGKKLMAFTPVPRKRSCLLSFAATGSLGFLLAQAAAAQAIQSSPPAPMQPVARDGAEYRWVNK